jgi:nucleoside-diphosphate-sugar epimerase
LSGKKIKLKYIDFIEKLPINYVNTSKIKKLGWKQQYKIKETLKTVYKFWEKQENI